MVLDINLGLNKNNLDIKDIDNKIINYFDNYINNDIKTLIPDYINQVLYTNKIDCTNLILEINNIFIEYFKDIRKKIREYINKDQYMVKDYINIILNIINKIDYYKFIFHNKSKNINNNYSELYKYIISDSIIFNYIYDKLLIIDKNNFNIIYNIVIKLPDKKILNHFLLTIKNLNIKNLNTILYNTIFPINSEINNLYKFKIIINNIMELLNYYKIDDNNKILLEDNIKYLLQLIYEIISKKDIDIINFIVYNNNYNLDIILKNYIDYNNDSNYLSLIYEELLIYTNNNIDIDIDINTYNKKLNILLNIDIFMLNNKKNFNKILAKNLIKFINSDNLDNFINYIDNLIKINKINKIINLIISFKLIKNYNFDILINKYYDKLILRLMNYLSLNNKNFIFKINNEIKIYNNLNNIFKTNNFCGKILQIIVDTKQSYYLNNNINNNITTITTSYNNWNINQLEGVINLDILNKMNNSKLCLKLIEYEKEYNFNNNKKLSWFPHYGEVECDYLNQTFKMLPIQFIILELFNDNIEYDLDFIYNLPIFNNYSLKFKNIIIHSLILSKLLFIKNNKIIVSCDKDIKYNTNLISLFLSNLDYEIYINTENENKLLFTRIEIINSHINSLLKINSMNKDNLYIKLKESIKLFNITNELLEESLNYMIKYDYIISENDIYKKIYY